eukprot:2947403-Pleurochrysis_carterae.AAC.2
MRDRGGAISANQYVWVEGLPRRQTAGFELEALHRHRHRQKTWMNSSLTSLKLATAKSVKRQRPRSASFDEQPRHGVSAMIQVDCCIVTS